MVGNREEKEGFRAAVLALVSRIPAGEVATYGQIAAMLGAANQARRVGMVLAGLRHGLDSEVPWHRVINAAGGISAPNDAHRFIVQRSLLEAEGVVFGATGRCDLRRYRWDGVSVFS